MSITINGATNTLTAASGLTIAGNTAVTGTLSATTCTQSGDLSAVNLQSLTNSAASYANTNNFLRFINSAGNPVGGLTHPAVTTLGLWGNTGVKVIGGSSGATTIADFTTASGLAVYDSVTTKTYQLTLNGASSQNLYLGALGSSGQYITGNAKYSGSWTIDDATKGTASVVLVPATGAATAINFGIGAVNTAPATVASITAAGLAVTGTLSASGITSVTDATDATSTTSASLKTAGGLATAKKIIAGDSIKAIGSATGQSTSFIADVTPGATGRWGGFFLNSSLDSTSGTFSIFRITGSGNSGYASVSNSVLFQRYDGAAWQDHLGFRQDGFILSYDDFVPAADNTYTLGVAALGWKELFCDNGTINTSDARRKTEVSALSAAEINAAKQLAKEIGSFKFLAAVAEKGDAARLHIGMTVQRAIEIMEANGLNPFAYSFICHDAWDQQVVEHAAVEAKDAVLDAEGNVVEPAVEAKDAWTEVTLEAGDKYSFRAHELLLFTAAGFEARLSALEAA